MMNIKHFIEAWIATGNQYDTKKYLDFYWPDAVLEDPSVGSTFKAHKGIQHYFESYFIGYQTQTRLVSVSISDTIHAHLEVEFTGDFPEGKIGGMFDFTFRDGKIAFVKADLIR